MTKPFIYESEEQIMFVVSIFYDYIYSLYPYL